MKRVKGTALHAVRLDDKYIEAIELVVREVLREALESSETHAFFPIEWAGCGEDGLSGKPVKDPLTIYVQAGFGDADDLPTYKFSLRDCLKDTLETCKEDGSFIAGLRLLSPALRKLTDEIDAAIAKGSKFDAPSKPATPTDPVA